LFVETTTIGARSYAVQRRALARETVTVQTQFGRIDVKVVHTNGAVKAMPEFDQCRIAAAAANVPLREVQEAARAAYVTSTIEIVANEVVPTAPADGSNHELKDYQYQT
jgi:uncharacterized protein (DUF111 family)